MTYRRQIAALAATLAVALAGCRPVVPQVPGGSTAGAIPGGPAGQLQAAANPAQPSSQTITKTVEQWTPQLYAPLVPVGTIPPLVPLVPQPPAYIRTSESIATEIGPTQDLAGIVREVGRAAAKHWRSVVAVLLAGAMAFGAYLAWRREWPTPAAIFAAGAVAQVLTLSPWVGVGAVGISALVVLAWRTGRLPIIP